MNVIMHIILAQRISDTNKQNVFVIPKYWFLITQIKTFPINARCFLWNDYLVFYRANNVNWLIFNTICGPSGHKKTC